MIWLTVIICFVIGCYAGFIATILMTGKQVKALKKELDESIPKSRVRYIIHNQMQPAGKRKNKDTAHWNGALMAVENALNEDLE